MFYGSLQGRPALGMFEEFGRTGPPILGGRHVAVGGPLRTPLGSLQRPPESRPPVKHTSLHNRLGVL